MAQFNPKDPRYQRDLQRLAAKRSMGPGRGTLRSAIGEVSGKHAGYQLGRQLQFQQLAQRKKAGDIQNQMNKARLRQTNRSLKMSEKELKSQQAAIPFQVASGLVGMGLGAYEGYRRSKALKESTRKTGNRKYEIDQFLARQRHGKGSTGEGALLGLRAGRYL